jgi:GNAT superfamily N-acetyltransferase
MPPRFPRRRGRGLRDLGLSFPAGAGISLVMKELFVAEHGRGQGVGKALLSALVDVAEREGCERFDWSTDGTNSSAQAFYAAVHATPYNKQAYRVPKDRFSDFQSRL